MKTLLGFFLSFLLFACNSNAQTNTSGYKVNDAVADFSLKNIDGTMKSLRNYQDGKGIIVIFTCNHCPFSVAYEDRIIALHNKFASKGFPVLAINPNDEVAYPIDSYENMIERAKDKGFPFAYVRDESQEIARRFGAMKTPHVFLLRKAGDQFVVSYIGAIDDNTNEPELVKTRYVENAIEAILKGEEVKPDFTKAVGCSIKWKQ